jgi:very-short-patch-repair endonuclease
LGHAVNSEMDPVIPDSFGVDGNMDRQCRTGGGRRNHFGVNGDPVRRERAIALIARRQNGVAGRDQLIELGLSRHAIDGRVKSGRLRRYFRGVYLVGPIAPPFARETAAVIACGVGAALSHRSAAELWGLLRAQPADEPVDVTVPGRRPGGQRGIRVHWVAGFDAGETTRARGIAVTTPARTLLDLAPQVSGRELEQAVAQATKRNLVTRRKLVDVLARYPRRPGARALRVLLMSSEEPVFARSEAEERFLGLVRRAQLPPPEVNVALHGYEVDFLWRDDRVAVEIDGFAFHGDRDSFEADRRRDADLAARGIQVIRINWRQIADEPEATLVRLAREFAGRSGRG